MDETTDYYGLLGVEVGAHVNEIKAAFKRMALKYHPDVYNGPDAEERMRSLLTAYKTLTDPGKRRAYDLAHGISRRGVFDDEEEFGFFRAANGRGRAAATDQASAAVLRQRGCRLANAVENSSLVVDPLVPDPDVPLPDVPEVPPPVALRCASMAFVSMYCALPVLPD